MPENLVVEDVSFKGLGPPDVEELAAYPLPELPFVRLRIVFEAEEPARLPRYQGSMLRGAFGHALRRLVCALGPAQECASCPLRRACVHPRLFEPFVEGELPPFFGGSDQAVRPYVFEPSGRGGPLAAGDPLRFDLLLLGQAVDLQAYAILALERMARAGLGPGRARFRLAQVEADTDAGPAQRLFTVGSPVSSAVAQPQLPVPAPLPPGPIALEFLTPLRLKIRNRLSGHPGFRDLAFHALRRLLELAYFHVPGTVLDWTLGPLLDQADAVRIVDADLHWCDWERWSERQKTAMKLGGLVGTLTLEGNLAPFTLLLRAAEIVHVGKGTTFGLGKVVVRSAAPRS